MTVFTGRVRREYLKRRSVGQMVLFSALVLAVVVMLVVAARDEQEQPQVVGDLTPAQRHEVVRSWYAEVYPAYVVAPRR